MKQSLILSIETSGAACSVALSQGAEVLGSVTIDDGNRQSSMLVPAIESLFRQCGKPMSECDAVAVSSGPGSYTGLRVGVSTAKGLCYGLGKPLISVPTLEVLLAEARSLDQCAGAAYFVPMLDARRMEVYSAVYDRALHEVRGVQADIVDADTYRQWLDERPVYFFGPGAAKCMGIINHPNAYLIDGVMPVARWMQPIAERRLLNRQTEDVAYYEPFYLKDFVAKKPRNLLNMN